MLGRFPFGAEVRSVSRLPDGHRPVFLLGAYPSALHVRWDPPSGASLRPIKALAVDNEPEPFWDGRDEAEHVAAWTARHFDKADGRIRPAGRLNGSSGRWVRDLVLEPLAATMDDVWLTDCLDSYRCSAGQSERLADTYGPYADQHGLPKAQLQDHPNEGAIVLEALDQERTRLLSELRITQPTMIVTLGRAAAGVVHDLLELDSGSDALLQDAYGDIVIVSCNDKPTQLLCLAHPGAPGSWQQTHLDWVTEQGDKDRTRASTTLDRAPRWLPKELLAAGADAPQVLAGYVAQRLVEGSRDRARRRQDRNPNMSEDELVEKVVRSYIRLARSEGAVAGLTMTAAQVTTIIGTAGKLTLPAAVTTMGGDLTALAWLQCRMILEIASLRGQPLDDPAELQIELLSLWGLHSPTRQVGRVAGQAGQRIGKRLLERYLRGAVLQSLKAMFRVVGIKFSRAALVRALPVVNIPINAAVNDVSTRGLARKADRYYREKPR